jgi:hypothetical protein
LRDGSFLNPLFSGPKSKEGLIDETPLTGKTPSNKYAAKTKRNDFRKLDDSKPVSIPMHSIESLCK